MKITGPSVCSTPEFLYFFSRDVSRDQFLNYRLSNSVRADVENIINMGNMCQLNEVQF